MKKFLLITIVLAILVFCKEKNVETTEVTEQVTQNTPATEMNKKCTDIESYVKGMGKSYSFVPVEASQDGGSETYKIGSVNLEEAFKIAKNCFSSMNNASFGEFKKNGNSFSSQEDQVFIEISIKLKDGGAEITYSSGI